MRTLRAIRESRPVAPGNRQMAQAWAHNPGRVTAQSYVMYNLPCLKGHQQVHRDGRDYLARVCQ